jgi:uncharacterized protein YkwD
MSPAPFSDVLSSIHLRPRSGRRVGLRSTAKTPTGRWNKARRAGASVLLTALAVAGSIVAVPAADASTVSSFAGLINGARASAGLTGYQYCGDLAAVAQGQAQLMAASQRLYHNPNLTTDVKNWVWVGENVGYGPDVSTLFSAFMHSAPHRANILDHDFTQVGVGAVTDNGTIWVSMVFRRPNGASSSSPVRTHVTPRPKAKASSHPSTIPRGAVSSGTTVKPVRPPVVVRHPLAATVVRVLPAGVSCIADPRIASRIRYLADEARTARLVAQSERLVLGFQCGAGLAPTAVLDPPTLRALRR